MTQEIFDYEVTREQACFIEMPKNSNWTCYLFGNKPNGMGLVYVPREGQVPNWFVRWMMKICFDCTWVKGK